MSTERHTPGQDFDLLEEAVSQFCIAATASAFLRALSSGRDVCIASGSEIIMVDRAGEQRILVSRAPTSKVKVGVVYKVSHSKA